MPAVITDSWGTLQCLWTEHICAFMQNHQWLWNEISPAFEGMKSGKNSFTLATKGRTGKGLVKSWSRVPRTVRHTWPFLTVSSNGAASFGKQTIKKILEYSWQRETSCSDCSSAVAITFLGGWKFELRTLDPMTKSSFYLRARASIGEDENHPPHNILKHHVWTCFWLFWTKKNRKSLSPRLWRTAVRKDPLWQGHSSKAASVGIVSRHNTTADALKVLIHYLETLLSTHIPADGSDSRNVMC